MSEKQNEKNVVELRLTINIHLVGAELAGIQTNDNANNQIEVQQADNFKQEALGKSADVPQAVNDQLNQASAKEENIPKECIPQESSFLTILNDADNNLRLCIEQMQEVANAASYIDARDCVEGLMEELMENGQLANFRNLIQEVQRVNTGAGIGEAGCDRQAILDALDALRTEILRIIEVEEAHEKERQLDQMAHQVINDPNFQETILAMVKAALKAAEK